jgi:hypothetical protein
MPVLNEELLNEISSRIQNEHKRLLVQNLCTSSLFWSYLLDNFALHTILLTVETDPNEWLFCQRKQLLLAQVSQLTSCLNIVENEFYKLRQYAYFMNDNSFFITDEFLLGLTFKVYEAASEFEEFVENRAKCLLESFLLDNLSDNYLSFFIHSNNIDLNNNRSVQHKSNLNRSDTLEVEGSDVSQYLWQPSFQNFDDDCQQLVGNFKFLIHAFHRLNNQTYDHTTAIEEAAELNGTIPNRLTFASLTAAISSLGYFDPSELFYSSALQAFYDAQIFNNEFKEVFQNDELFDDCFAAKQTTIADILKNGSKWVVSQNADTSIQHSKVEEDRTMSSEKDSREKFSNGSACEITTLRSRNWTVAPKKVASRTFSSLYTSHNISFSTSSDETSRRNSVNDINIHLDPIGTKPSSMYIAGNKANRQYRKVLSNEIIKFKQTYEYIDKNVWKYDSCGKIPSGIEELCSPFISYNFKPNLKFSIERRFLYSEKYPITNVNIPVSYDDTFLMDPPLNTRINQTYFKLRANYGVKPNNEYHKKGESFERLRRDSYHTRQQSSVSSTSPSSSFGYGDDYNDDGHNENQVPSRYNPTTSYYNKIKNFNKYHYISKKQEMYTAQN